MKITAFAGGVGGAKLADGLAQVLRAEDLSVIVNTGDDFTYAGLRICPDIDTVCYTLSGLANPMTGWGRNEETWNALKSMESVGGDPWFHLGDKDLGVHLERTRRISAGERLSKITSDFCRSWGVGVKVFPMTDDPFETWVDTVEMGLLPFQEYFVHQECRPRVKGFQFIGKENARPAAGVIEAIGSADCLIICPSNPWVSISTILGVREIGDAVQTKTAVAISPIIGGNTLKGPAAKMYRELGIEPSAFAVAKHYQGWIAGFVLDQTDCKLRTAIEELGMQAFVTNTIMLSSEHRRQLALEVLKFCEKII